MDLIEDLKIYLRNKHPTHSEESIVKAALQLAEMAYLTDKAFASRPNKENKM